ncbi:MAG: HAD-IA family hydrolase [Acidimicrobiales bacterium]
MIRAALFDFGGVVLSSPFEAFSRYEADEGLPPGFLRGLNSTNPDTNAWARLERSEVAFEEFCLLYEEEANQAGGSIDARQVMALLAGELRPAMVQAVKRCRERLKTACLTNNFVTGAGSRRAGMDEMFDAVIESSQVGVRKPDPRFYTLACELLEIEPSEAVFLDDLGINLKPAREMGMTTIKVEDPDIAIQALEEVVGFPLS